MDDKIRELKGSPREDQWRLDHKKIAEIYPEAEYWSGCNGDFFLTQRHIPIALLCLKEKSKEEDPLANSEKDLCNWCVSKGLLVFVIRGKSLWNCNVYKYELNAQESFVDDRYVNWERNLRENKSIYNKDL